MTIPLWAVDTDCFEPHRLTAHQCSSGNWNRLHHPAWEDSLAQSRLSCCRSAQYLGQRQAGLLLRELASGLLQQILVWNPWQLAQALAVWVPAFVLLVQKLVW